MTQPPSAISKRGDLVAKIAEELRRNDECGPGPVSRGEYIDDAAAILRIVGEHNEDEIRRLQMFLWECHCAASDGIPVPFERWLMDGGPEGMPGDIRELRDAYDTVCEERDAG